MPARRARSSWTRATSIASVTKRGTSSAPFTPVWKEGLGDLAAWYQMAPAHNALTFRFAANSLTWRATSICHALSSATRLAASGARFSFEMDILTRINWNRIDLSHFDTLQLNPTRTEDFAVAVGLDGLADASRPAVALDVPLDSVFIPRQISELVRDSLAGIRVC